MDDQPQVPSLPTYNNPQGLRIADQKEAAPMMKLIGKMMAKHLPRVGKNPNIHSQTVKLGHKKQQKKAHYW